VLLLQHDVQGKVYPDSILYEDITWDAARQYDEGRLLYMELALHCYGASNVQCTISLCGRELLCCHQLQPTALYFVS
jgi:hypothetical protein